MKIGILSDTHNHLRNLQKAMGVFEREHVDLLVHCGDFTQVETLQWLCEYRLVCAFGNGDFAYGELLGMLKGFQPQNMGGFGCHFELGGKRMGVTHGHIPRILDEMLHSGLDYVFTGHTHRRQNQRIGHTRVINPGALGGTQHQSRSVCILDLETEIPVFEEIQEK
jgi:putative phosphoesterase